MAAVGAALGRRSLALASSLLACLAPAASAQRQADVAPLGAFEAELHGLAGPCACAYDERGRLHVVEELACRVSLLAPDGARVGEYGRGPGSGPGELRDPRGIALAPESAGGERYVADAGNHRVVVFDAAGRFARAFGKRGPGAGELCWPEALALELEPPREGAEASAGAARGVRRVFVSDRGNARVAVFDARGAWLGAFGPGWPAEARLGSPAGLALDERGRLWIADALRHHVLRVPLASETTSAPDLVPDLVLGAKGAGRDLFDAPVGIACGGGRVYVCERENHRVQVLDADSGRAREEFGLHALAPGQGAGRLHFPEGLALDASGDALALCEPLENRVQRFGRGELAPLEALPADAGAHFGLRLDARDGLALVSEPARPSLLVYDLGTGEAIQIGRVGRYGTGFGALLAPVDAALLPGARALLVADEGTARLSRFALQREPGAPLRYEPALGRFALCVDLAALSADPRWDGAWPILPGALEVEDDGHAWLLDARSLRLLRFDAELELRAVHALALPEPESARPVELAFGPGADELCVLDAGNRRVLVLGREGALRRVLALAGETRCVRPFGLAFGPAGGLWVADEGSDRLLVLEPSAAGALRFALGRAGFGPLEFHRPAGLARAGERLLVLDHANHRVQVLDARGRFLDAFGPRLFVLPALRGTQAAEQTLAPTSDS